MVCSRPNIGWMWVQLGSLQPQFWHRVLACETDYASPGLVVILLSALLQAVLLRLIWVPCNHHHVTLLGPSSLYIGTQYCLSLSLPTWRTPTLDTQMMVVCGYYFWPFGRRIPLGSDCQTSLQRASQHCCSRLHNSLVRQVASHLLSHASICLASSRPNQAQSFSAQLCTAIVSARLPAVVAAI